MTKTRGQLPMYIEAGDHQAFVRYESSGWPGVSHQWVVYCPGCAEMALSVKGSYQTAYAVALEHRIDEEAWIPAGVEPYGPWALWGPTP